MMSSKEHVKRLFSDRVRDWAAHYSDLEARTLQAQNLFSRQRFALEMVEAAVPRASKVLDAGCGTGDMVAKLIGRGYEGWGLDMAEPMIRYARDRCRSDRFWVGDIEHIPFRDNSFDAVVCLGVIEYLDTDEQALREIWRVLKPGGQAVVSTPSAISPLHHMDRVVLGLMTAARPLYQLVKYRLRGRRAPFDQPSRRVANRRYSRGSWLRLLRSVGLEAEEYICHGWGWYGSRLGLLVLVLSRKEGLVRRCLERFIGGASLRRASDRFVRSRALNWLASEQLVRVRAVKSGGPLLSR
jgi:ubiquinone/menaquinone biosynthesis C-methylase UbiE